LNTYQNDYTYSKHKRHFSNTIIKKILKAFDVEVIEQTNEITNPEIIERLEKHHKNFQDSAYREENYTKVDAKNIWA
jgi:predicted ester cyclase